MALWGAKVTFDKPLELSADEDYNTGIYNAALLSASNGNTPVHLFLQIGQEKYLVGTFRPNSVEQFPLTIEIYNNEDNSYKFTVSAESEVHLTGSLLEPDMGSMYGGAPFDSDSDDDEMLDAEGADADGPEVEEVNEEPRRLPVLKETKALKEKGPKGESSAKKEKPVENQLVETQDHSKTAKTKKGKKAANPEVDEAPAEANKQPSKEKSAPTEANKQPSKEKSAPAEANKQPSKEKSAPGSDKKGQKRPAEDTQQPHVKKQKTEGSIPCSQCTRKFTSEQGRDQHVKHVHNSQ